MPQLMKAPKAQCPGSECPGCSSASCYAKGGETGVNKTTPNKGQSEAGSKLKPAFSIGGKRWDEESSKDEHRKTLEEMRSQKKPNLYAEGGEIDDEGVRGSLDKNYYTKGVHSSFAGRGNSKMGSAAKGHWSHGNPKRNNEVGHSEHSRVMSEMSEMKKADRSNLAEGGEVGASEHDDMDSELHEGLGEELLHAFESKDKKKIMSCIEAAVLSCMNKE